MSYANTHVRAHGATVTIGTDAVPGTPIEDCTVIAPPGDKYELVEKTTLGSSRKEYDLSDTPDADEIVINAPYTGAASIAGSTEYDVVISLPKTGYTLEFTGYVVSDVPQSAEVGGLLKREITIKPTSAAEPVEIES